MILSNKVILTPPAPGNARGGIWGANTLRHPAWATDVEFRATGPEWGGGKFGIWLVKDGQQVVGTSSIYTVGKFDGLALVIDTYAGSVRPRLLCLQESANTRRLECSEAS
jgi:lectin, mannose-binding 1